MPAQDARIDGQGNVIVQIEGDRNTVNLKGLTHLTLTRYLTRRHIGSDVDLLSPYTRSIPLIGREQEMADLRAWLTSDQPISVRVLTGGAGAGKTRLALELCEAMLGEGWDAGFLENGELVRFRSQQNLASWGWQRPTLIVIDHAAVHAERLSGWLKELSDNPGRPERPLRILLLERHAETGSGWWQTAFGRGGWGAKAAQRLLDPAEPRPLEKLALPDCYSVVQAMLSKCGKATLALQPGLNSAFDHQFQSLPWGGEPLFLMIAAMLATECYAGQVFSLDRTDLTFVLADRELNRIAEMGKASGIDPDLLQVMAGYVTLCRGLDRPRLMAAVEAQKTALGLPGAGDPGKVARVLSEALSGTDGSAGPILPDMIGEAAMLRAFEAFDDRGTAAVQRAFVQAGQQVAASVIRTAQDFAAADRPEPLVWLDALVERDEIGLDQLLLMMDTLPHTSFTLLERSAHLTQKLVDMLRGAVEAGHVERLPALAAALNNLAGRLRQIGRPDEALGPAEQAVELYGRLAASQPDAYEPDLAMTLSNLASCLGAVGRRSDALVPAEQAVELYRKLAALQPNTCEPHLAMTLNNLAVGLNEIGRRAEALALVEEAVVIHRKLAPRQPDVYEPALAMSLNNLATFLSEIGRRSEALAPAKQAVELYRKLAAGNPDAYEPALGGALNNLAIRWSEIGNRSNALAAAEQAAETYRKLAAHSPDTYVPDLAMSLNTLSALLSEVGRRSEALAPAEEALAIRRKLAARNPDAYERDLASSLNNLANRLSETGRRADALVAAEEAVEIYRKLAARYPDAYQPVLAMSLNNLANHLSDVGHRTDALASAEQAVRILAPHFMSQPAAYTAWMQTIARNYLERCQEARTEPDVALLGQIAEGLRRSHRSQNAESRLDAS